MFQEKGKGAYLAYASSLADGEMPAVKKAILMVSLGQAMQTPGSIPSVL